MIASAEPVRWNGREATRLTNGLVELVALTSGGHLTEFQFCGKGLPSQNVLWEAPWMAPGYSGNPVDERLQTGGFTGHALCLDYFGTPSPEEAAAGLPIHGEAGARQWKANGSVEAESVACRWNVHLPVSQLSFERKIHLRNQESVVYVEETVHNERDVEHACQWVQHATFSPPFLNRSESTLAVSAARGITSPTDYEGGSLLAANREFVWPHAPRQGDDGTTVDLRQPFSVEGFGFGAGVELDPRRQVEFLLAMNWKLRLGVGYCFRREDFPWMALWEENCTRPGQPWNRNTQARGMEFGTTPLSVGREASLRGGNIFGMPTWCVIPAHGQRVVRYLMYLFEIPAGIHAIENVETEGNAIVFQDELARSTFSIPAYGCERFLLPGS